MGKYLNPWTASEPEVGCTTKQGRRRKRQNVRCSQIISGVHDVNSFVSALGSGALWVRVGEFAAGAILLT